MLIRALAIALLVAAAASLADAAPQRAAPGSQPISYLDAAKLLIVAGKLDEAQTLLEQMRRVSPSDPEAVFLLGIVAETRGDYRSAIADFRAILVDQPSAVRVRLELGRAFFLAGDFDNAERQFRLAEAGALPTAVRAKVDGYLSAIRDRRSWRYNFSVAAAPDTNLNGGPSIRTVDIFGLPFQLSDEARRQSGVGLALDAGGEWSPTLRPGLRLRLGAQLHTALYGARDFDDTTLSVYAGPRWVAGKWDVSPMATYYRRWYGRSVYNEGSGGSLQTTYYATPRLAMNGGISGQYVAYRASPEQSGPAVSGSLGAIYALSSASFVGAQASGARQWAGIPAYANTAFQAQIGYYRDLPGGFSISLQPSWARVAYDARLAAFAVARVDTQWTVQATLLDRRIDIAGFTPRLLYAFTRNASNIPLYAYARNRFEVGVTRLF